MILLGAVVVAYLARAATDEPHVPGLPEEG